MNNVGTPSNPLRVAIIGAGPTGFYAAEHLLKEKNLSVEIDMFDRLPTPFGLVRGGVAPDHQKIKTVTKAFDRIARKPNVRFYGYVELSRHVSIADLRQFYHQVILTTGAQTDRRLNIPGEDLRGSHPATEFVAWYNGHPDFRDCQFDLSGERAAVVGIGNVAMDVARILARSPQELLKTDIADHALEALRQSSIKEIYILGRRGPAQAKFTPPEAKELGELELADVFTLPEEVELDPLSKKALEQNPDRATLQNLEILQNYAKNKPSGKPRKITIRFLVSPVELIGDDTGKVVKMKLVKNELYATEAGTLRPRPTGQYEELPVDLVFRSVGYRGVPIPGVPFHDRWGVILNDKGRVIDPDTHEPLTGLYTAGWIKRGPSGVIGTNKPDAAETVTCMLEDLAAGKILQPEHPGVDQAEAFIKSRQPLYFSYEDWLKLDQIEVERGQAAGRPRIKFTRIEDMLAALGR
ncbi:MAG: NADP oxidoreductase [Chloroflexi bacterium]|nr:MAG: NADP oxidoreductase [Chloroflexota bacterium]